MEHIVIIGNGISGITAARHIRKLSDKKITIISAETEHFFSRTALMYIYMGHMKYEHTKPYEDWFWKKNRIDLKFGFVKTIDTATNTLHFDNSETLQYDKLIVSTGSKSNKFGWKGQDLDGVIGLYSKQDLDQLEALAPNKEVCQRAVVVGGGLIGIELTEMLHTRNIPVTLLVREDNFWDGVLPLGDAQMINRHIKNHGIDLRLKSNLKEISADENGRANAVIIEETSETISCNLVGLTAGVTPNIDMIKTTGIETDSGVLVNRYLETNIEHIYAIGDCAQQREPIGNRKPVEAVWYTGRMMGETVAQTICGNRIPYNPGHWFNSAKFFDIEYQTYGWVFAKPKEGHAHFHWKHDDDTKSITIEYHESSNEFLGINTFGIRMKHEVFDRWLTEKRTADYVMEHLKEANFDPEFYKTFERNILNSYSKQFITT
ncbi:pyridine nucleotide-disulfide oxidoreductase [Gelidibacter algens]|jgi:NAD(P)H-nitrite reductase large subunit|uniref:Pyridine nucleotide-disulfide oxidoreductase n=1 Tax=Gelidibacter algens TaxID=49280 RepID=A0A1A7R4L1_9FLAO|nr:FAD-dependent oxidoreductase [Gelidibacter algens]OBX26791.1 NADH dehydrogenase [Gelidibacter algens]RAJ22761.1 pyridine nucleotide-disulfide oxidoreductase [Gelidibacter algens]